MTDDRPVTISVWTLLQENPPHWHTDDVLDKFHPNDPPALTVQDLYLLMRYAEKNESRGYWFENLADSLATAAARLRAALPDEP